MGVVVGAAPKEKGRVVAVLGKDGGAAVPDCNWTLANGLLDGGAAAASSFVAAKALVAAGVLAGAEDRGANFLQSKSKRRRYQQEYSVSQL